MKETLKKLAKEHGVLLAVGCAVILLQTVAGVFLWDRLPERIATHFGMNNEPNGWSSRTFTVFGMPLVLLALHLLCILLSVVPHYRTGHLSPSIRRMLMLIIPATSLFVMTAVYGYALGAAFDIGRVTWVFVGVIFMLSGNYLPKTRRNPTMGIKLPWTLGDDDNWDRTHRLAGPVWLLGGLLLIVCGLIGSGPELPVAAIAAVIVIPTAYSYALHVGRKKETQDV